ncbi:MAG: glutamate-5-semialdehyde dehydrogenase [Lachnospiraceae bacterium]|nr:glutamate-5-semialdehyde dehydrogenase [Lachnospiraceae bacterium]
MTVLEQQGEQARVAAKRLATASTRRKNKALLSMAEAIGLRRKEWLAANEVDITKAREDGMSEPMLDRLKLTDARIDGIIRGIREVVELPDPIGCEYDEVIRPNGLKIVKRSVPLGVIAIIYEARPNVTVDAAALTLKSGNAVILRGGKEAIESNKAVIKIMRAAIEAAGLPADCVQLVASTDRESANELMHLNQYVDVLIPRGGRGLIRSVVANAGVPVIRTGEGVCHVYIDEDADLEMGAKILYNAKCQRPSVCNAAECVIVHESVLEAFFKEALPLLDEKKTILRCDERALAVLGDRAVPATEEDWDTEYGNYTLAVKTVDSLEEAIAFIDAHTTGHSEAIVTENDEHAAEFLNRIDAAAVYVNASTRFTDGGEFGLGAEIGISTQKMHARGPMGLKELTSYKYVVVGAGQVRE